MTLKEEFNRNGVVGPIEVLTKDEAAEFKKIVVEADDRLNLMKSDYRCKSNVLFPWVDKITKHPNLVKHVTELLGPNFHCWDVLLWFKKPGDGKNVGYHQDATYWNFNNRHKGLTAWFTFDDCTDQHGGVEYILGSHQNMLMRHVDIKTSTNLLMRGQTVDQEIPKTRWKTNVPAGHALLHSPFVIHGSEANLTNTPRYAMGIIYVSTECRPVLDASPESTIMVSGVDKHNYMVHDPAPTGNWDTDVINWKRAYDWQHNNYFKMEQRPFKTLDEDAKV